jgi:hypothetical protein
MKRVTNTTGLKATFVPVTDKHNNRFKLTQTNINKSIFIDADIDTNIIDFISAELEKIESIDTFSYFVDNTQSKYNIFNIAFKGTSFENILEHFKKFK